MGKLCTLAADTRGVTALEYALIAAIVSVVTVGAMQGVGTSLLQNFSIIVDAAREAPEPMAVVESSLPAPPRREAPRPTRAPVPDLDDDDSSAAPAPAADAPEPGDIAEERAPGSPMPGIAPSDPALGPAEEEVPVAVLITPPGAESSASERPRPTRARPAASLPPAAPASKPHTAGAGAEPPGIDDDAAAAAPPGRESSEEESGGHEETEPAARSPAAWKPPPPPMLDDRQKAAIRSGFILLLWAAFTVGLANLIWRIATRKAHQKEVADQLEGWQPASFG